MTDDIGKIIILNIIYIVSLEIGEFGPCLNGPVPLLLTHWTQLNEWFNSPEKSSAGSWSDSSVMVKTWYIYMVYGPFHNRNPVIRPSHRWLV